MLDKPGKLLDSVGNVLHAGKEIGLEEGIYMTVDQSIYFVGPF